MISIDDRWMLFGVVALSYRTTPLRESASSFKLQEEGFQLGSNVQ